MKTTFKSCMLAVLLAIGAQTFGQPKCPTNFDGKSLEAIKNEMPQHKGETIAFDGAVVEIKKGYNDVPYFSIRLDNGDLLWIASLVSDKYVTLGAKLRLIGYIELVQTDDEIASQFNQTGYHVRVFAMLDLKTKQLQISNAFNKEVKVWLAGKFPSDLDQ